MKESIIHYETAKLAKEKGFDIDFFHQFYAKQRSKMFGIDEHGRTYPIKNKARELYTVGQHAALHEEMVYKAVTQSLIQRWLREEHDIHVLMTLEDVQYDFSLEPMHVYSCDIHVGKLETKTTHESSANTFLDYETELELGLRKGLKLIKTS